MVRKINVIILFTMIILGISSISFYVYASGDSERSTLYGVPAMTTTQMQQKKDTYFELTRNAENVLLEPGGCGNDFVMFSVNAKARKGSVRKQMTFGYTFSELDTQEVELEEGETAIRYVDPTDEQYVEYNENTSSNKNNYSSTVSGKKVDKDPHQYIGSTSGIKDRVSFVLNKYYIDGNYGADTFQGWGRTTMSFDWTDGSKYKDGRLNLFAITIFNYSIVKTGAKMASMIYEGGYGEGTWYGRWQAWEDAYKSGDTKYFFAFGVDPVKTISASNYETHYKSANTVVQNGKLKFNYSVTSYDGTDDYMGNDLLYQYPASNPRSASAAKYKVYETVDNKKVLVDEIEDSGSGWHLASEGRNGQNGQDHGWYVVMANGIYNFRRTMSAKVRSAGVTEENIPIAYQKEDWLTYSRSPYLAMEGHTGTIVWWNNFAGGNASTYGWKYSFKKYFVVGETVPIVPIEDTAPQVVVNPLKGYFTKGGTPDPNSPIEKGTSGDRASGDKYTAPNTWTYNNDTTGKYNIGEGIPTTESYTNFIDESTWYGTVTYEKVTTQYQIPTTDVRVYWTRKYKVDVKEYKWVDEIDNYDWVKVGETWNTENTSTIVNSANHGISSTRTGTFYRITDVNLYEAYSTGTLNKSLNNSASKDGTTYTSNYSHSEIGSLYNLPYTIIIDGNAQVQAQNGSTATSYRNGTTSGEETALLEIPDYSTYSAWYQWNDTSYLEAVQPSHSAYDNVSISGEYESFPTSTAVSTIQTKWNEVTNNMTFKTSNDTLNIAGISYIDNVGHEGKTSSGNEIINTNNGLHHGAIASQYEMVETQSAYPNSFTMQKTNTIPISSHNGTYYTNLDATYKRAVTSIEERVLKVHDIIDEDAGITTISGIKDAIKPGYEQYEGVIVFSPVIAPMSITGESSTQLADTRDGSAQKLINQVGGAQFILDGTYTITIDGNNWNDYASSLALQGYGDVSGYQKYVRNKYVSFPFSVELLSYSDEHGSHTVNKYFEPTTDATTGFGAGYTEWINLSPTATSLKIYVPTWAEEGAYIRYSGMSSVYDNADKQVSYNTYSATYNKSVPVFEKGIRFRVEANNIPTELVGGQWVENENAKADKNYSATFCYPCQISGIMYEFEIDSIYDAVNWSSADWQDEFGLSVYNFVTEALKGKNSGLTKFDAEKRVGTFNRLGTKLVRYTGDGDTTTNWKKYNTLGLMSGKSASHTSKNKSGYLVAGQKIGFTLKTIANLDDNNDGISIKPSFTYYDKAGNKYTSDQIEIWYLNDAGDFILMGSKADIESNIKWSALYDYPYNVYFDNTYFDYMAPYDARFNTFNQTAAYDSVSVNQIKNSKDKTYSLGSIYLSPTLRLITANEEEMKRNLKDPNTMLTANRYSSTASNATSGYDTGQLNNTSTWDITNIQLEAFGRSMQTWYGIYEIPNTILVHIKNGTDTNGNNTEMDEYVDKKGSIKADSDYWIDDGQLALYFDITSVTEGDAHLKYYGSAPTSSNMWKTEKGKTNSDSSDDDPDDTMPDGHKPKDGFIGIIEKKYAPVSEHYKEGILYMN